LPDEARLLGGPGNLADLIAVTVDAIAAPRPPDSHARATELTPWATQLMSRVTFHPAAPTTDLIVREFLNDLAHAQYNEVSKGLWQLRGLSPAQIESALYAVWCHPDVALPLAAIVRHDNAESFSTLGQWISAGTALDGLLDLDPNLAVVSPGVFSYRQRQLSGEPVVLHRVILELHAVLSRLAR
jgi:hypothetical protein